MIWNADSKIFCVFQIAIGISRRFNMNLLKWIKSIMTERRTQSDLEDFYRVDLFTTVVKSLIILTAIIALVL